MNSKLSFDEEFSKILYDFTHSILYYKPKDILDFSVKYFYSLENQIPLSSIFGTQINTSLSNINKKEENSSSKQPDEALIKDKSNTNDYDDKISTPNKNNNTDLDEIKVPISKEMEELIKKNEEKNKNEKEKGLNSTLPSENDPNKKGVRDFRPNILLTEEFLKELEERNKNDIKEKTISAFSGISATDSQKQGVRDFVSDILSKSKINANEQLKDELKKQ